MNEKDELLLQSANLLEKAEKIEKQANPNNIADYDLATQKADRFVFEALFAMSKAIYGGKI